MKSFQRKRGWRNILHSRPVLAILFILLLIFAWSVIVFMGKMSITRENKKIAESQVTELEEQKLKLTAEIAKLGTSSGIEESIREKFPVVKEGEGVIIIVEDENQSEVPEKKSGGFFSFLFFWKKWFK